MKINLDLFMLLIHVMQEHLMPINRNMENHPG
jgi:hypothetical protein